MTGWTYSKDYPVINDAFDKSRGYIENDSADAFLTIIDEDINRIIYSTFLGGTLNDKSFNLALDFNDNIILAGYTLSEVFQ